MPYSLQFSKVHPAASAKSIITIKPNTMKMPLFSDNSNVYYKPKSMSTGVGTVKNSRRVGIKT
jgi:hypothetical protein